MIKILKIFILINFVSSRSQSSADGNRAPWTVIEKSHGFWYPRTYDRNLGFEIIEISDSVRRTLVKAILMLSLKKRIHLSNRLSLQGKITTRISEVFMTQKFSGQKFSKMVKSGYAFSWKRQLEISRSWKVCLSGTPLS